MAIEYKKNPPKDDFMADVLDLLGDDAFDDIHVPSNKYGEDEEF